MRNLYKYILILSILCFTDIAFSQSNKILYYYKGTSNINTVNISNVADMCFDRKIVGVSEWFGTGVQIASIKADAILNNSLSDVYRNIPARSNIIFPVQDMPVGDNLYDEVSFKTSAGFNQNFVAFNIDYMDMNTSVDLSDGVSSIQSSFPISTASTYSFPTGVRKYLNASTSVESQNASIISTASSITTGCTDLRSAILKICMWIESNIEMDDTTINAPNKSTEVFFNTKGDCDGVAHLLAAFCRSLNIPARIVSGYFIENGFSYPTNKAGTSTVQWGSGNGTTMGGHSACEIYIPSVMNWVRCDPAQRTILFGTQNFIKMATGLESTGQLDSHYGPGHVATTQNPIPQLTGLTIARSVSINSPSVNYSFVKSEPFTGTAKTGKNGYLFCAADPLLSVGFYDKLTIQDPPAGTTGSSGIIPNNTYLMTPCSPGNFYARFLTESTPATYSTGFDWSIILYRANGDEYVYAQQDGMMPNTYTPNYPGEGCCWQPTIGILPAYDWLYDPSGNIYGKVKVTVHISDGDTKTDETTIGVNPLNNIHDVTYSTNTTVDACAELNLTNVTISGTPIVTFNTNGLGITINGAFEAPVGSTLIINK